MTVSYDFIAGNVRGQNLHFECADAEEARITWAHLWTPDRVPDGNCDRCGYPLRLPRVLAMRLSEYEQVRYTLGNLLEGAEASDSHESEVLEDVLAIVQRQIDGILRP